MSLLTTLQAARRGIAVASEGINVVGHNTANATTEGFSKRTMSVTTMYPLYRNGVWLGQGPSTPSFHRSADAFIDQNMIGTAGAQKKSEELYSVLSMVQGKLADGSGSSVLETYRKFQEGMRKLSNDPEDPVLRDQLVMQAETFTNSVNDVAEFLIDMKDSIREDMQTSIVHINDQLATVANLNKRLKAAGGSVSQGDLQDQRDLVIKELASVTGMTVRFDSNGQANVYMDGHVVVQEENYRAISYYEDSSGDPQLSLAANAGGITITSLLGGKFGARTEAYAQVDSLLSDFNDWVTTFTNDFNAVHQTGFDQNGSTGLDFFSVSTISPATSFSVDANLLLDSSLIAAGGALNPLTGFPDAGDKDVLDLLIGLETSTGYGATGVNTAREQLTNMFTDIATQVRSAEDNYDMQTMRMEDIMELRNSVSGVNLDEEAVKLMEYQASYSAASRVISVTNSLLGSLMEIV